MFCQQVASKVLVLPANSKIWHATWMTCSYPATTQLTNTHVNKLRHAGVLSELEVTKT